MLHNLHNLCANISTEILEQNLSTNTLQTSDKIAGNHLYAFKCCISQFVFSIDLNNQTSYYAIRCLFSLDKSDSSALPDNFLVLEIKVSSHFSYT